MPGQERRDGRHMGSIYKGFTKSTLCNITCFNCKVTFIEYTRYFYKESLLWIIYMYIL